MYADTLQVPHACHTIARENSRSNATGCINESYFETSTHRCVRVRLPVVGHQRVVAGAWQVDGVTIPLFVRVTRSHDVVTGGRMTW